MTTVDRALMNRCNADARVLGVNSFALYAARRDGFETVAAHVAAKRAAAAKAAQIAAEKRAAERGPVAERAVNVVVSRHLRDLGAHWAFEVTEADVLAIFDATDAERLGDVLYRRGTDGRVTRVMW